MESALSACRRIDGYYGGRSREVGRDEQENTREKENLKTMQNHANILMKRRVHCQLPRGSMDTMVGLVRQIHFVILDKYILQLETNAFSNLIYFPSVQLHAVAGSLAKWLKL